MTPRLIRRRPLVERIKAYLNPLDFLLRLSEEMDSTDWDQWNRDWASPIGIILNIVFLVSRANMAYRMSRPRDDVFGDDTAYTPWMTWFVSLLSSTDRKIVV